MITVQTPAMAHLNPRPARTWREIIEQHMQVKELTIRALKPRELEQGASPGRRRMSPTGTATTLRSSGRPTIWRRLPAHQRSATTAHRQRPSRLTAHLPLPTSVGVARERHDRCAVACGKS